MRELLIERQEILAAQRLGLGFGRRLQVQHAQPHSLQLPARLLNIHCLDRSRKRLAPLGLRPVLKFACVYFVRHIRFFRLRPAVASPHPSTRLTSFSSVVPLFTISSAAARRL